MSSTIGFSIGLITENDEFPARPVQISTDTRMELIIFNNFGLYNKDFVILCGHTEIWNAKEHGGIDFDLSSYDGQELMVYDTTCQKYKILIELRKAYKNATDQLCQFFVKTPMIHVEVKINKQQVTCLVDTGAQLSIISKNAAERCGILNLLDTRFKVDAAGVGGVRNALGKILQVEFEFPGYLMPVVLTVFECGLVNDAEVIIGVDVLTAYNANIDFKNQCVLFNDEVRVKMVKRE